MKILAQCARFVDDHLMWSMHYCSTQGTQDITSSMVLCIIPITVCCHMLTNRCIEVGVIGTSSSWSAAQGFGTPLLLNNS